jgi:hypothetical protein
MVSLNGTPFNIYNLDTEETLKERIAAKLNTLPSYILFKKNGKITHKNENIENIEAIDMLEEIKEDVAVENIDIIPLYERYSKYLSDGLIIIKPWLAYNNFLENKTLEFAAISSIESLGFDSDFYKFLEDKKSYKSSLEKRIKNNKLNAKKIETIFKSFQKIKGKYSTDFELDVISFSLLLNITNVSLMEIFNNLILSPSVPLASIKNFFKIYRNFKPPISWSVSLKDVLVLKVTNEINEEIAPIKSYNDIFISLETENGDKNGDGNTQGESVSRVVIVLDFSETSKGISKERMIDRILNSIKGFQINIISEREEKLKGIYYYPSQSINKYIFADLVMNDPVFSLFIDIDESIKATKAKNSIYFYFTDPQKSSSNISVVITEKMASETELKNKKFNTEPYLRVRISKAKNYGVVQNFIDIFSKLIEIYNNKYEELLRVYKEYIPNFGERTETETKEERKRLKDIAPEIFYPLYSKKCNKKPIIVGEKTALEKPENERILFPVSSEENQNYYICPFTRHKYPGIFVNSLGNKDRYPYLPCCYTKDKSQTKGSNYRKYFYGEENEGVKTQQTVLITNKTVTSDGFGYLPKELTKLFEMIDLSSTYYRKGVSRSKSSFLECVLEALYEETGFLNTEEERVSDDERREKVSEWRNKISSWEYLVVGKQELYDLNTEEISATIKNQEVYLSPERYIRILESYFQCNIFLFSRDNYLSSMILPRFSQAFLRYSLKKRPTVLIYEHYGSKTEKLTYPQCELIIRWNEKSEAIYNLSFEESIVGELDNILERIRRVYNFELVKEVSLPNLENITLINQTIDSYGKTRVLEVKFEENNYSIITEPIPPLILPEKKSRKFLLWSAKKGYNFLIGIGVKNMKQNLVEGVLKEFHGIYGNIKIILPLSNSKKIGNLTSITEPIFIFSSKTSDLLTYNYTKKISRYIISYCFYVFSLYIYENEIEDITSVVLESFVNEKIIIIPEYNNVYKYKNITKEINLNSNMFQNGKLIIPSEEVLKKVIYVLRLGLQQQFNEIVKYHEKKYIPNFYTEITDFDIYPDQIILQGEDSVEKWILDQDSSNILNHKVISGDNPYFFQNNNIGKEIYIAQNVKNLKEGINIGKIWTEKGYNIEMSKENKDNLAFNLYSYSNNKNIKPYNVLGKNNSYGISVIGYKKEGIPNYTVIMPI